MGSVEPGASGAGPRPELRFHIYVRYIVDCAHTRMASENVHSPRRERDARTTRASVLRFWGRATAKATSVDSSIANPASNISKGIFKAWRLTPTGHGTHRVCAGPAAPFGDGCARLGEDCCCRTLD